MTGTAVRYMRQSPLCVRFAVCVQYTRLRRKSQAKTRNYPGIPAGFSVLRERKVRMMITTERTAVRISETGMEYSTPSSPKKSGSRSAKPTPNTISRTMERRVEAAALPHGLQKNEGRFVDARRNHHAEIDAERLERKVRIIHAFVFAPNRLMSVCGKTSAMTSATSPTSASAINSFVNSSFTRLFNPAPRL